MIKKWMADYLEGNTNCLPKKIKHLHRTNIHKIIAKAIKKSKKRIKYLEDESYHNSSYGRGIF